MAAQLEYAVRPFQIQPSGLQVSIEVENVLAEPVAVHLIALGNAAFFSFSFQASSNGPPGTTLREVSRENKRVRIENPNDSSQFVEVDRVKSISMRDEIDPSRVYIRNYRTDVPTS